MSEKRTLYFRTKVEGEVVLAMTVGKDEDETEEEFLEAVKKYAIQQIEEQLKPSRIYANSQIISSDTNVTVQEVTDKWIQ